MPVNHRAARLALRTHLLALPAIVTTGDPTLSATATGFARLSGSFVDDGFLTGMEVYPIGFTSSEPGIIEGHVTALAINVSGARVAEGAGGLRTLSVTLPDSAHQAWENVEFDPEDRRWFVEEEYLPGGSPALIAGNNQTGEFATESVYIVRLYGVQGTGSDALDVVAGAIVSWFRPGLTLSTYAGQNVRVRSDAAPYPGQLVPQGTGHAVVPITIPLYAWTTT